jgi:hypothetical protein
MSADVMLVPIGFIIDAYKGIGFKVCEEEQNITTLRRDEEIAAGTGSSRADSGAPAGSRW